MTRPRNTPSSSVGWPTRNSRDFVPKPAIIQDHYVTLFFPHSRWIPINTRTLRVRKGTKRMQPNDNLCCLSAPPPIKTLLRTLFPPPPGLFTSLPALVTTCPFRIFPPYLPIWSVLSPWMVLPGASSTFIPRAQPSSLFTQISPPSVFLPFVRREPCR